MPDRHLKKIMIIDPASRVAEIDCFNQIAQDGRFTYSYHLPALMGFDSFQRTESQIDGIIIFGSSSSVYDDDKWQAEFIRWLRPQLNKGVPCLGLCYGHQLIAHLFGAKVDFIYRNHHKITGFCQTEFKETRLNHGLKKANLVTSHREAVIEVPKDMTISCFRSEVAIDGLEHQSLPIFTFQQHPEATKSFLNNQSITVEGLTQNHFEDGQKVISSFLDFCHGYTLQN